jgi:hypothetical protein
MNKRTTLIAVGVALLALFAYDYWTMRQELELVKKKANWSYAASSETQSILENLKHELIAKSILID